uniref:SCAN box domain-containing protein n=2 Tax=Suricata suricatta TaxID=37032 RepID=A0A673TDU1_SURSU
MLFVSQLGKVGLRGSENFPEAEKLPTQYPQLHTVGRPEDRGRSKAHHGLKPWSYGAPPRPRETPCTLLSLSPPTSGGAPLPVPAAGYKALRWVGGFLFSESVSGSSLVARRPRPRCPLPSEVAPAQESDTSLFQSPRMETEGYLETQREREAQNDEMRSPSNEMLAEESEVVLGAAPQAQVPRESSGPPAESLEGDSVEDLQALPRRSPRSAAASRQRFRKFRYEDASGPREVLRHLQELAGEWLRPDIHTKEQIVEMLVQEQFQAVLPEELRARAQRCQPGVRITG